MNTIEVQALQVGDRVGYVRYGNWGISDHGFGKVTKITKTGQITVESEPSPGNTRRFKPNGYEMGDRWSSHHLVKPEDLQATLDRQQAQRETNRRAKELIDEIEKHKNGMRDYHFDEEARGKLLALVAQL